VSAAQSSRIAAATVLAEGRDAAPKIKCCSALKNVEQNGASDRRYRSVGSDWRAARARERRTNRGSFPAHVPRSNRPVDIEQQDLSPAARVELHRIGEDKTSGWTSCRSQSVARQPAARNPPAGVAKNVRAARAPARLIEGGLPTEATIAQVLVSQYSDHLPLDALLNRRPARLSSWKSIHAWPSWVRPHACTCVRCRSGCW